MRDVGIGFDEGILRKVVTELRISPRLGKEETPNRRLLFHNQSVESLPVAKHSHLCDERDIGWLLHL